MTAKQKQCLLTYLGYDTGGVDGLWGDKSRQATLDFQLDYGLEPDGVFGDATAARIKEIITTGEQPTSQPQQPQTAPDSGGEDWWKDIKYFTRDEPGIACPCGRCGGFPVEPTEKLIRTADSIREELGPMIPSSTVRCQAHNDELQGSAKNSYHLTGRAMDFSCLKSSQAQSEACLTRKKAAREIRYWYHMGGGWYHFDVE